MSLSSKSALITGGTGGMGSVISNELLNNGVECLAVLDLDSTEPEIVAEWRKKYPEASIKYFSVDVSSHEQLEKCYVDFTNEVESLDIVVNCAGIFDEYSYRKVIEVNLCGIIGSTHLAVKHMRMDKENGKGGVIINLASIAGVYPISFMPTYGAVKHAVVTFTRSLAHGRDHMGIKFLTLCPGGTLTPMVAKTFKPSFFFEMSSIQLMSLAASNKMQSVDKVSEALLTIMEEGKSGSVWIIDNGELKEHFGTPLSC